MPTQFDPKVHLAYSPPESRVMMEELGKSGEGISPVGITQPFPLLSEEGVLALREELFSKHVLDRCTHTSDLAPCQIRGMSCRPGFASFNESLWTHPETLRAVSEALTFGAETLSKLGKHPLRAEASAIRKESVVPKIIPGFNNLPPLVPSTESDTESEGEADLLSPVSPEDKKHEPNVTEAACPPLHEPEPEKDEHKPVVGCWVCVLMLSDATTMQGGETALACADGTVKKVRGPQMGWAIMLQGRYIDHVALGAYGAPERVTMVGSSFLECIIYQLLTLSQWSTYRLDLLSERFKMKSDAFKTKRKQQSPWGEEVVNKDEFKAWCKEQIKYLQVCGPALQKARLALLVESLTRIAGMTALVLFDLSTPLMAKSDHGYRAILELEAQVEAIVGRRFRVSKRLANMFKFSTIYLNFFTDVKILKSMREGRRLDSLASW
ncbi:hypothetical protein AG1IA_09312 [Rhizoctonia solani AG-1 IA]|uniref:Uncharacterized protein n=1 Tax=Thanatephorus cucumeris (strain AG1-IA) TaxID=983506 RepID=L8WFB7_THACA|nr:hypothetical protein AG1IA_09312 [Rhizoctonia solani AG-1 IA]